MAQTRLREIVDEIVSMPPDFDLARVFARLDAPTHIQNELANSKVKVFAWRAHQLDLARQAIREFDAVGTDVQKLRDVADITLELVAAMRANIALESVPYFGNADYKRLLERATVASPKWAAFIHGSIEENRRARRDTYLQMLSVFRHLSEKYSPFSSRGFKPHDAADLVAGLAQRYQSVSANLAL